MGNQWDLYPLWHKNFLDDMREKLRKVTRSESLLTNHNTYYAKSMQRMIALYDDVIKVCESHAPGLPEPTPDLEVERRR